MEKNAPAGTDAVPVDKFFRRNNVEAENACRAELKIPRRMVVPVADERRASGLDNLRLGTAVIDIADMWRSNRPFAEQEEFTMERLHMQAGKKKEAHFS